MAENNRTEENRAMNERIIRNMKRAAKRGKRLTFKNTNNVREFSQEPGPLSNEFQRPTVVGPNYRLPMRNWRTILNAGITLRSPGSRASGPIVPYLAPNNTRRNNAWSIERNRLRAVASNEARHLGINSRERLGPNAARAQGKKNHIAALEEESNSLNQFVSKPVATATLGTSLRPARPQSASPARSALGAMGRAALAPAALAPVALAPVALTREQRVATGPTISLATARPAVPSVQARRSYIRGGTKRKNRK
jgi:hypothetical protein